MSVEANNDYGLSPAEIEFFASRGSKTAQLLQENEALEPDRERANQERGGGDPDRGEPTAEELAARQPDKAAPAATPEDAEPDAPIDPTKPPRRVSYNRFKAAEDERTRLAGELAKIQEKWNRGDERLRLIQEALATDAAVKEQAAAQQPDADPEPNMNEDIFKWAAWAQRNFQRQNEAYNTQLTEMREQINADRQVRWFEQDQQTFAAREPKYPLAYEFLLYARKQELMDELLQEGVSQEEVEARALQELEGEVTEHVGTMRKAKKSPAQSFYAKAQNRTLRVPTQDGGQKRITMDEFIALRQAQMSGGKPPAATAPTPQASTQRTGSLANPQAPQPGANQPVAQPQKPTPSQIIEGIRAGQDAAKSLSNGGGGSALQDLDAAAVADLPIEEFQAILNQLQRRPGKDKERLRAIFGA